MEALDSDEALEAFGQTNIDLFKLLLNGHNEFDSVVNIDYERFVDKVASLDNFAKLGVLFPQLKYQASVGMVISTHFHIDEVKSISHQRNSMTYARTTGNWAAIDVNDSHVEYLVVAHKK